MKEIWQSEKVIAQTQLMARSLKHWTGRDLFGARTARPPVGVQTSAGAPNNPAVCEAKFQTTGGQAVRAPLNLAAEIFHASFILVSHGTEADPVLNYGNAAALALWEMPWAELTRTPSRLTAEAPNREERARLLAAVTANGFIDDYSGIRISKTGRRFHIAQATVWNLLDERGIYSGQAAMFSRWEFL